MTLALNSLAFLLLRQWIIYSYFTKLRPYAFRCPCSFWYFQNIIIYCHELFKETIICQLTTCTLGNMDSIKEYFSRKSHLIFEGGGRVHIQDCCVHPSDTSLCSQKNSSTKNFIWSKNWIAISEFHANHLLTMQICELNLESYVTNKKKSASHKHLFSQISQKYLFCVR